MPTLAANVTRASAQTGQLIVEKWTQDVQQPFDKAIRAKELVTDRSGLVADGGDTINIPTVGAVNARAKAASTNITYDDPTGSPITIAIDKHYYVGVLIEDIAKVQSSYNLQNIFKMRMAEALARQIDTDILAKYASAGTSIAGGATIDDADILAVVAALDAANVPDEGRAGIVSASVKGDLLGINKYTAYDQTGVKGRATDGSNGMVTEVYGMRIMMSQNVPVSTTTRNLFFHKSALSLAQQQKPKFETEYSVDALGWKTALHCIYGVGVERAAALIELTRT